MSIAQFMFPIAGITMSIAIYWALKASENARDRLKDYWYSKDTGDFPPAFSERTGSRLGRIASTGVPIIVGLMWLTMLIVVIFSDDTAEAII